MDTGAATTEQHFLLDRGEATAITKWLVEKPDLLLLDWEKQQLLLSGMKSINIVALRTDEQQELAP